MNSWNAMTFEGRDNMLRVVRQEAGRFFELASPQQAWEQPTGCANWQVRDIVGHLVDTTESYFGAFDTARNHGEGDPAYGLPGMASRVDAKAQALRSVPHAELLERAQSDFAKMTNILEGLGPAESELGIRITSGPNAGDTRVRVSTDGLTYEQGDASDLPTVIEFEPASFVLTAFGRYNAGTIRGDVDTAERYLSSFFRI